MKLANVVGIGSEIAQEIAQRLTNDGWSVVASRHNVVTVSPWDLLLLPMGDMRPIGKFFNVQVSDWENSIEANALLPLRAMRKVWHKRLPNAHVVFFGGPNLEKPTPTYSAYRCGKAMLEAIVPTLNDENDDCRFHVLHPGVVNTKIHLQTIEAGEQAVNFYWAKALVQGRLPSISHDQVYAELMKLIA